MKKLTSILLVLILALSFSLPALADGFNAGVEVSAVSNDSFTVTVPASNDAILAAQKPTLTAPCPSSWTGAKVTFNSEEIESTFESSAVSFTVEKSGVYTITKDGAETQEPTPTPQPDPPAPTPTPAPATETVENEDGSKTTTVTNPDGSTVETTENADGSEKVVETAADGSVTETTTAADGSTGTVKTDADGAVTAAEAAVSADAAEAAAESGEAVTLPIEVPSAENAEEAVEIAVSVPESAGAVKVEIPVTDVSETDVIILVHDDGTEEILPAAAMTEDGLVVEVEGDVTIKIVDNSKEFSDMPEEEWAEQAVNFVASRELFNGSGDGSFNPDGNMNRAMLATVLYRLERQPDTEAETAFDDVPEDAWYSDAVAWAQEEGIVEGYGDSFGAGDDVTREQLAVMLWRLAGKPAAEPVDSGCSDWAAEAMSWAIEKGLILGNGDSYDPLGNATRAQTAAILMRYVNL